GAATFTMLDSTSSIDVSCASESGDGAHGILRAAWNRPQQPLGVPIERAKDLGGAGVIAGTPRSGASRRASRPRSSGAPATRTTSENAGPRPSSALYVTSWT